MKHKVTIGVFAIITNEKDEILLVHRNDYDLWNLPWGALDSNESPWDGVIREVKEETWLDVEVTKLLWIYSKPTENDIVINFLCKEIWGKFTLNEEARDIRYFSLQDMPQNTIPKQVDRINDYVENKNEVIMKVQGWKSTIQLINEWKL